MLSKHKPFLSPALFSKSSGNDQLPSNKDWLNKLCSIPSVNFDDIFVRDNGTVVWYTY